MPENAEMDISQKYDVLEESSKPEVVKKEEDPLIQQFNYEQNKAQIEFEKIMASEQHHFSAEKLQLIKNGEDAHLDDPELFVSKKHLLDKFTPLSATHAIIGKFKDSGINHKSSHRKNPADGCTMLFSHYVNHPKSGVQGIAEEPNKKLA